MSNNHLVELLRVLCSLLFHSKIERILQQILVIGPNVESNRKSAEGMEACTSHIER